MTWTMRFDVPCTLSLCIAPSCCAFCFVLAKRNYLILSLRAKRSNLSLINK
ncbi:MAG: hypothetical protein U0586_16020 [Candidatus Brocadiaceae bacterium]